MARFEVLAAHLRTAPLPQIERALQGVSRQNAAFIESYFSNYVALTRKNVPKGFVDSLAKMARWSSQFDYSDIEASLAAVRQTNALEESPVEYRLLNVDGGVEA